MKYSILGIASTTARCANYCRYCLVGSKDYQNVPFAKIKELTLKLHQWAGRKPAADRLRLSVGMLYTYNISLRKLDELIRLRQTVEHCKREENLLLLNGIHFVADDDWENWLREREQIGITTVGVSLSANQEIHDRWSGRKGEFRFLLEGMRIAGAQGLKRNEKLFLSRSTLPHLETLMDVLDKIPGHAHRDLSLFTYSGWARKMEEERISRSEYDGLSPRFRQYTLIDGGEKWKSEGEWIGYVQAGHSTAPREGFLRLDVREDNIDRLLETSCDDIVDDLTKRTDAAYAVAPSIDYLAATYGDRDNARMYGSLNDLRTKWLDHYFKEHPTKAEVGLATWF